MPGQQTFSGQSYNNGRLTPVPSNAAAPLNAPYRYKPGRQTVVLLGESITARNHLVQTTTAPANIVGDGSRLLVTLASSAVWSGSKLNFSLNTSGISDVDGKILEATNVNVNSFTVPSRFVGSPPNNLSWTNQARISLRGWWHWANMILGCPFHLVNNAGIGSENLTYTASRLDADVINYSPEFCFIMGGINDLAGGSTPAEVLARLVVLWERCAAAGITPIVLTILPLHQSFTNFATVTPTLIQLNAMIKSYCMDAGFFCIDTFAAMVDPSQADGRALPNTVGITTDFIHPLALGARLVGEKIAADFPFSLNLPLLTASPADNVGANAANYNLIDQAPWASVGGTVTAPCTGVLPTGFSVSRTAGGGACAASVVARTVVADGDAIGNNAVLTLTGSALGDAFQLFTSSNFNARMASGGKYQFRCTLKISGAAGSNLRMIKAQLLSTYNGTLRGYWSVLDADAYLDTPTPFADGTYTIVSPIMTMPVGGSFDAGFQWFFLFEFGAAGTPVVVSMGRQTMQRLA